MGGLIEPLRIEILLDEKERTREASPSPDHDHGYHARLAVCVSCCGASTHYETPWHGVTEGFRLCWPSLGPLLPSVSWPSPSAPTTGFTLGHTSATPLTPPRTTPRCKPRKSKATWRTPGYGGSAVSKVKQSLISKQPLFHKLFVTYNCSLAHASIFPVSSHLESSLSDCLFYGWVVTIWAVWSMREFLNVRSVK